MSEERVRPQDEGGEGKPLLRLMSHSTMHIDLAACIRNLLLGIAAIVMASQGVTIDLSAFTNLLSTR
jgi:hypothetical protein